MKYIVISKINICKNHFNQISKHKKFLKCFFFLILLSTIHHRFWRNEERESASCMFSIGVDYSYTSAVHWMNEVVDIYHRNTSANRQEWCTSSTAVVGINISLNTKTYEISFNTYWRLIIDTWKKIFIYIRS